MKRLLLLVLLVACTYSPSPTPTGGTSSTAITETSPLPSSSPAFIATGCTLPSDPNSHVYNPDRLKVIQPCITVTGIIDFIRHEADGDYHIGLALDAQYINLVNTCNKTCLSGAEHGDLVVEPVCVLPVTQADAKASCVGYHNPIVIPPVGSHVSMTGAYVLDTMHGWLEIHPLIEVHKIS